MTPVHREPVSSARVAGVILAAGSSTRMGASKALLDAGGTTFVARLADTLLRGGCAFVVAVAGSATGPVAAEIARGTPARLVVNPGGEGGQLGSLRAALADLGRAEKPPAAIVFTPVDNPAVAPETVEALISAWRSSRASILTPEYRGKRGHPVLVDMAIAPEFHAEGLRGGARTVVRRDPGRVLQVPVPDSAILDDLDTPGRYRERFAQGGAAGPVPVRDTRGDP